MDAGSRKRAALLVRHFSQPLKCSRGALQGVASGTKQDLHTRLVCLAISGLARGAIANHDTQLHGKWRDKKFQQRELESLAGV